MWGLNLVPQEQTTNKKMFKNVNSMVKQNRLQDFLLLTCSMFGRAYDDARMPNWRYRQRTPLPGIATSGRCRKKGRTLWGRQSFCTHFFFAIQVCGRCDSTLPLFRNLGLGGKLAAGCLRSRPAWIVFFCFRCWVADSKTQGDGEVQDWVLSGGGYGPLLPLSPPCGTLSERQKRPPGPIHLHFSA